jgi:heterodisulfide reductase subunit A
MTEKKQKAKDQVLVVGAGMAGIEASLTLAAADKKVYLVEKEPLFGGKVIKFEEVFANMECSTCMAAPKQQEVLQSEKIELLTLSKVKEIQGEAGNFTVKIEKKARYVSLEDCIGCNECFEPCPVSLPNGFEENLAERKAIYIPCPGALPNAPSIDTENCLRFTKGKDCQLCKEACMFEAIDFDQKDEELKLNVGAIIVATGFDLMDPKQISDFGYDGKANVYTALEIERLYASNGPTEGKITLRNGKEPASAAMIHCVGRKKVGYCSAVCCMYNFKFIHYLKDKLPEITLYDFYSDLCMPGKSYQPFYEHLKDKAESIRFQDLKIAHQNGQVRLNYKSLEDRDEKLDVDMAILAPAVVPAEGASELARILGIEQAENGFFGFQSSDRSPGESGREGIYLAGCVLGPEDIGKAIAQADAAAGRVLALLG